MEVILKEELSAALHARNYAPNSVQDSFDQFAADDRLRDFLQKLIVVHFQPNYIQNNRRLLIVGVK